MLHSVTRYALASPAFPRYNPTMPAPQVSESASQPAQALPPADIDSMLAEMAQGARKALPGTLPVMNKGAVERAIQFGLAIGAHIAPRSIFTL